MVESTSTRRLDDGEEETYVEYSDPFCKLSNLQSEEEGVGEVNIKRELFREFFSLGLVTFQDIWPRLSLNMRCPLTLHRSVICPRACSRSSIPIGILIDMIYLIASLFCGVRKLTGWLFYCVLKQAPSDCLLLLLCLSNKVSKHTIQSVNGGVTGFLHWCCSHWPQRFHWSQRCSH